MAIQIRRRKLLAALSGTAAWPLAGRAQQADRVRRVGVLMPYARGDDVNEALVQALKQRLEDLGWVRGRNIQFDERWTVTSITHPLSGSMYYRPNVPREG